MSILSTWDPDRLLDVLLECARIALKDWPSHQYRVKGDGTLVTERDEAIEALLTERFHAPQEGSHIIGEETCDVQGETYLRDALDQTAWIVDPIDGTAPYAHGLTSWGTSIGYARHGILEHGAIILPTTGEIYITTDEGVFWSPEIDPGMSGSDICLRPLESAPAPWTPDGMVALGQQFAKNRILPWPNPVVATGCAINVLAYLMQGHIAAYLAQVKLWDVAGVLPMLRPNGIAGCLLDGTPIDGRIDESVYVMSPGHPHRWAMRDSSLFAPMQSLDDILARVQGLDDEATVKEVRQP